MYCYVYYMEKIFIDYVKYRTCIRHTYMYMFVM